MYVECVLDVCWMCVGCMLDVCWMWVGCDGWGGVWGGEDDGYTAGAMICGFGRGWNCRVVVM